MEILRAILSRVRWKNVTNLTIYSATVIIVVYAYLQHVALKQNQLIYRNPSVMHQTRVIRVQGPVRIVTRVVETPGRVERETVEDRGPVSVVRDSMTSQSPAFPPVLRSDRWLAGISYSPEFHRESREIGFYAGYGFKNRIDLCVGIQDNRPSFLVLARF